MLGSKFIAIETPESTGDRSEEGFYDYFTNNFGKTLFLTKDRDSISKLAEITGATNSTSND